MGSLIALLTIVVISLIIVRIGSQALMMTGLSWDTASFQSYSAFFGVGFTTSEAEMVVDHPIRRRIIRDLILAGNIGLTSGLATLIITFTNRQDPISVALAIGGLVFGAIVLILIAKIRFVQGLLDSVIRWSLQKAGVVRALDYELLLRVKEGYCISEIEVLPGSPLADKSLRESRPSESGIILLGITRKDKPKSGNRNLSTSL